MSGNVINNLVSSRRKRNRLNASLPGNKRYKQHTVVAWRGYKKSIRFAGLGTATIHNNQGSRRLVAGLQVVDNAVSLFMPRVDAFRCRERKTS